MAESNHLPDPADQKVSHQHFSLIYDELRKLAAAKMAGESGSHSLDATSLVHEMWLKLNDASFPSKNDFLRAAGMDSRQVLARFDAERQALALMDHPNIAKVLDGGLHKHRPYFVITWRSPKGEREPLLLSGYEGIKQREKAIPPQSPTRIPESLDRLINLYTAMDRSDEAKKYRAERARYPFPREVAPLPRQKK